MPKVNIPDVGVVNFPDDMPASEIQRVIETEILPQRAAPTGERQIPDMSETIGDRVLRNTTTAVRGLAKGAEAVKEGPMRLIEGAGELMSSLGGSERLGRYNEAVESGRSDRKAEFEATYGRGSYPEFLSKASELGFGMATGGTEAKAVKTLWGAVKEGAKVGALAGGTQYSGSKEVSDKVQNSLVGGALGAGFGAVPGSVTAGRNLIRRYLTADPVPEAAQAAQRVQGAFPSLQGELTIGQQTGNVRTIATEAKVAQRIAQEQWLRQQKALVKDLEDLSRRYGPDMPAEEVVKRGQQAIVNSTTKLRMTRKAIWNADLDAIRTKLAADAGAQYGGEVLVDLPGLAGRFNSVLGKYNLSADQLSPRLKTILEDYGKNAGALKFDDLDFLLQQLNDKNFSVVSGAAPNATPGIAGSLRRAVDESLDEIADISEVGVLLKEARSTYSSQSRAIAEINQSAVAKALGVDKKGVAQAVQNPEAVMRRLLELSPAQQRQAMSVLRFADPALTWQLKGMNIRTAIKDATSTTPAGVPNFDIKKFIDMTVGEGHLRAKGLYSPADADILEENLKALNVLLNRAGYKAPVTEAGEVGMTAVGMAAGSGSLPFAARILGKIMNGFGAEKVLFNPQARKEFLTVANTWGSKSSAGAAALGRLSAMLGTEEQESEDVE
jgi:hypothetical protein